MARKVLSFDTALSSLWAISKEGVRRKQKQKRQLEKKETELERAREQRDAQSPEKLSNQRASTAESLQPLGESLEGQIIEVDVESLEQEGDLGVDLDLDEDE